MATQREHDERIQDHYRNREVDAAVNAKLAEAGINKPEDLQPGRLGTSVDAAMLQSMLQSDSGWEIPSALAEKAQRDREWAAAAAGPEQPTVPSFPAPADESAPATPEATPAAPDRLTALEAATNQLKEEAERFKKLYGQSENKVGDLRKQLAEMNARTAAPQYTAPQPQYASPQFANTYGRDPNEPITMGDAVQLLMAQQTAFGNVLRDSQQQVIEAARALRNYDLTSTEEADILERHPYVAGMDRATQMRLMADLVGSVRTTPKEESVPSPQPTKPRGITLEDLARAKIRTAGTFIEPSMRGAAAPEVSATTPANSALAQKVSKLRELAKTPGGAAEMEQLIASLSSGARR